MTSDLAVLRPRKPFAEGWIFTTIFFGFAVWWFLGLSNFVWLITGLPMLFAVLLRQPVRVPRGFFVWAMFLGLAGLSVLQVVTASDMALWIYRFGLHAVATIALLYAYNLDSQRFPAARMTDCLVAYWFLIVAGGFVAVVAPDLEVPAIARSLLPADLASNEFITGLVTPQVAQVHVFLGFPVGRPALPFQYTNDWGSSLALTTPFVLAWSRQGGPGRRWVAMGAVLVALVPMVQSLNRGLWLTLGLGVIYAAVRYAARGNARAFMAACLGLAVIAVVLFTTPLGALVGARAATGHSDDGRLSLYSHSIDYAQERPLTGYGGPVADPTVQRFGAPPVGSHGHFWFVLVSYGAPATVFFVGILLWCLWRSRWAPTGSMAFWAHVTFAIALGQMFVYNLIPTQWPLLMAVAGIALRECDRLVEASSRETPGIGGLEPRFDTAGTAETLEQAR